MSLFDRLILNIKRGETPGYRAIRGGVRGILHPKPLPMPKVLKPLLRLMYEVHFGIIVAARALLTIFYRHPLFSARVCLRG